MTITKGRHAHKHIRHPFPSGQTFIELIVGIGIFALIASNITLLYLNAFSLNRNGQETTQASFYAQQGLDATKSIRDRGWANLTDGDHGLKHTAGYWEFEGVSETIGKYLRLVKVEGVNRDQSGNIVLASGTLDPRTKKITVKVTWNYEVNIPRDVILIEYLTDWNSFDWKQDTDAHFNAGTKNNVIVSGTGAAAKVALRTAPLTIWTLSGGTTITQTTDADFNAGVYTNTAASGIGALADIKLAATARWVSQSSPTSDDIKAVRMVSAVDGWAVGLSGTILRFNGTSWALVASGTTQNLEDVYMVSASDGWAVGANGTILRWNGSAWSIHTDTGNQTWNSVYMVSATDGWVVGSSGNIYRWNGSAWSLNVDTGNQTWNSIYMVSATDGRVVGSSGNIYRWNGLSWGLQVDTGNQGWNSIYMVSATDGWVVGSSGNIYRWNGSSWSSVNSPINSDIYDINMVSASDGWAVGSSGNIIRWNGSSWSSVASPTAKNLFSASLVSATDGWTVGAIGSLLRYTNAYNVSGTYQSAVIDSGASGTTWNTVYWVENLPVSTDITVATRTGAVAAVDGTWSSFSDELTTASGEVITSPDRRYLQYRVTFTTLDDFVTPTLSDISLIHSQATGQDINAVHGRSVSDVWAVGRSGTILRWNGSTWSLFADTGAQNWNSVYMGSATDGWVVSNAGEIDRFNGASWSLFTDTGSQNWNSIYMVSASDGWVVGNSGQIYRFNGTGWSLFVDTGGETWQSVYMVSATDGWAVGSSGSIRRFNGTSWSSVASGTLSDLYAVTMVSVSDGWAVGQNGVILRWNGNNWSSVSSPTVNTLADVHFSSDTDGWAAGIGGVLLNWDGVSWTLKSSPTSSDLLGAIITQSSPTYDGWIVGENGEILRALDQRPYSGTLLSSVLDTDMSPAEFHKVYWTEILPISTDLTVAVRSGNAAIPDGTWAAFTSELTDPNGGSLILTGRYSQYRVTLSRVSDLSITPLLEDIIITYKQ